MNVIITGASKGLGFEIAKKFVQEGHNIAICSRNIIELIKASKDLKEFKKNKKQVIYYKRCDISNWDNVKHFVYEIMKKFKKINVLVNNAGVYGPFGLIEEINNDKWEDAIKINLFGTFHFMKAVIPHMKEKRRGKIINLSGGGATSPLPNISAYAASKTAIVRLTESIALECKKYNIDINSIAPGLLDTRLYDEVLKAGPKKVGKEFYNKIKNQEKTPLSVGVALCDYLASPASDGITGCLISSVWDNWYKLHEHLEELKNSDIYTLKRIVPEDRNKNWSNK